ncbi:ATP-binding protein [Lentzea sp. E54]|uniref:ATP-binding protein n=1 Tax=Lentzea xerophila TaxID=3435883 RepID=UPI003DA2D86F
MAERGDAGTWRESVLRVDSQMASLVAEFDWAGSELGPIEDWPESLRTAVAICLTSRFPILLWWGPELVMIYNDADRPILGASKHPYALGRAGRSVWPEIWHVIGPMLRGVLDGNGATWSDDQLLSNAVKYTLDGEIALELRDAGSYAELKIRDTGVGIPAEEMPKLFERFHRVRGSGGRSHEGSGIGLALVAELLRLLGGSISAESSPGAGSTFTVCLPYGRAASAPHRERRDAQAVDTYVEETLSWSAEDPAPGPLCADGRPRLLIAEDNADLRRYLAELAGNEYVVDLAVDGEDALRKMRAAPPDMLFADVMMPRLDGFGLLAALRADPLLAGTPVLLLSARAGEEATAEGFAAGADDYLVKPFAATDLRTRLRANLVRSAARTRDTAWRTAMLHSLSEGVFVADAAGVVVEVNDAFERITGWGMRTAPYPPPYPWWPTEEQDLEGRQLLDNALVDLLDERTGEYDVACRHREGHTIWLSVTATEIGAGGGGERMLVGTIRDVTREHGLRELRKAAVTLAAALASETDLQDLYGAAVHGFGELFGGRAMILVEGQATITVDGRQEPAALPGYHLDAQSMNQPAVGSAAGILIPAVGSGHRVWVEFPAPRVVTADEQLVAAMLGEVLAAGLDRATLKADRRHTEHNLRCAMESHRLIGQAVGILMERHRLTAAVAFSRLREVSQQHNVKLRLAAEKMIETGQDPADVAAHLKP